MKSNTNMTYEQFQKEQNYIKQLRIDLVNFTGCELIDKRLNEFKDWEEPFLQYDIDEAGCKRSFIISQRAFDKLKSKNKRLLLGGN